MIGAVVRDLWLPIWPNLAASVIWTLPALAWHHRAMRRHVTAEAERTSVCTSEHVEREGTL